ncbi:hypothetical protein INT44_005422 [Umbelopsis vinacea]|uniref:Oxidoreductase AflY n=1 Tax=Umbelopsis vinacea TaxID=44442 RepID=A0A8H7UN08_9FUNG|nr:hypothetical protein INT44_005422 [Umbelopsis vinacea]
MTGTVNANRNMFRPQVPSNNISLALPGITEEARDTVADLLLKNHVEYHCFFNEKKFHNHLSHGVLAAYSLGAKPDRIQTIYRDHASYQRPVGSVLTTFTESDWKSQLGNGEYYASYLEFFHKEVAKLGRNDAFIKYALDPDMISRSFSGAFHPLIHMGYGFDFEVDGILVEGLAMAALSSGLMANVIVRPMSSIEKVTSKVATQLSLTKSSNEPKTIVDMLTSIREDHDLDDVCPFSQPDKTAHGAKNEKAINKIQQCLAAWDVEETKEGVAAKSIELYKACVLALGATGLKFGQVKQDFFLMHAVTSVLFTHKIANSLPPSYAVSVMKSHLGVVLMYYISHGRAKIDVDALLNYKGKQELNASNPWLSLIQRAIDIDEVHVTKVVRACAFGDLLFGAEDSFSQICAKTAEVALDLKGDWDFEGVGYDEIYQK